MTVTAIKEAAGKAVRKGEDLGLQGAAYWMLEYGLITYKEFTRIEKEIKVAREAAEASEEAE